MYHCDKFISVIGSSGVASPSSMVIPVWSVNKSFPSQHLDMFQCRHRAQLNKIFSADFFIESVLPDIILQRNK